MQCSCRISALWIQFHIIIIQLFFNIQKLGWHKNCKPSFNKKFAFSLGYFSFRNYIFTCIFLETWQPEESLRESLM